MELQVIRHKTSEDFFKGFTGTEEAAPYSYQLQRMFESGAAREGDYLVVNDGGHPYLRVEIYRNNTRRIWEKEPELSAGSVFDHEKAAGALELVFQFCSDEQYFSRQADALDIHIEDGSDFSSIMSGLCVKYGFSEFTVQKNYQLKAEQDSSGCMKEQDFIKFTDLDPEARFSLMEQFDIHCRVFGSDPRKVYQDYLEESYMSEEYWKTVCSGGSPAGYFMPSFTSGLKRTLSLTSYSLPKSAEEDLCSCILAELVETAQETGAQRLEIAVRDQDIAFTRVLESSGTVPIKTVRRFFKDDSA